MNPLNQLISLFKTNKFFRIAIIFGVLFLILALILSPKKSRQLTPSPSPIRGATNTQNRPELKSLTEEKLKQASDYRNLVSDRLPILIEDYPTSVGISTNISIYYAKEDPPSTLRFEINGLSYQGKDSSPLSNPNLVAFQESFKEGFKRMETVGIDPKQVIFIYSDIDYIRDTANTWVDKLGLLK